MIFNHLGLFFLILVFCKTTLLANLDFESNKNLIFKKEVFEAKDWIFSHKKLIPRTDSEKSRDFAYKKAELHARLNIIDFVIADQFDVNGTIKNSSLRRYFAKAIQKYFNEKVLDLAGITKFYSNFEEKNVSVVLGLPKERFDQIGDVNTSKITDKIIHDSLDNQKSNNPFLLIELSKGKYPLKCIEYLLRHIENTYNTSWLSNYYNNIEVSTIPSGFLLPDFLKSQKFTNTSCFEKLGFLNFFCAQPLYYLQAGEQFENQGMFYCSQIMYFFGSILPEIDSKSLECYNRLVDPNLKHISLKRRVVLINGFKLETHTPEEIQYKNYYKIILTSGLFNLRESPTENEDYLHALDQFHEEPPNVEGALESLKKSLESDITANACNYLGRCLVLLGRPELAQVFFMQASQIDEKHPYAMANLAICYDSLGKKEAALSTARSAMEGGHLDDWAVGELQAKIFEPLEKKKIDD